MSKPIHTSRCHPRAGQAPERSRKPRHLVRGLLTVALIALMLTPMHEAAAQKKHRSAEMSAEEAAAQVQKRIGGQALGVEAAEVDGRKVYRVRILTRDGRVREITVNARRRNN